jgi:transposase
MLEDRSLVRTRQSMVRKQTRGTNQIKSLLFFYRINLPEEIVHSSWSQKFLRWIENFQMERASGDAAQKAHLEELKQLKKIIDSINRAIILLTRETEYRESVQRLKAVPGVSTLTAVILLTELCELGRFASLDQLTTYVGLIPDIQSSGETEHVGNLTYRAKWAIKGHPDRSRLDGLPKGSGAAPGLQ